MSEDMELNKLRMVDRRGDSSCSRDKGECSVAVLTERVKALETLIVEKNERISELKERIEELKGK